MPILLPSQAVDQLLNNRGAGQKEITQITCAADAGVLGVNRVTFPAVTGITQADYLVLTRKNGNTTAVNFDIDADGTLPGGATYTGATTKIEVDVTTGQTAAQVAAAAFAALDGNVPGFTLAYTADTAYIDFTATEMGVIVAPASKVAAGTAGSTFTQAERTAGVASSLQNKYCLVSKPGGTRYSAWFNVNSEGVDPAVADTTGVEVAVAAGASATAVATALAAALEAVTGLTAEADGAVVICGSDSAGDALNAGAGDSGFTVLNRNQGQAQDHSLDPAGSPGSISNTPSSISVT